MNSMKAGRLMKDVECGLPVVDGWKEGESKKTPIHFLDADLRGEDHGVGYFNQEKLRCASIDQAVRKCEYSSA
ncbi:hypothetical protein HOY82DRAFT_618985 [Tuber indicum]|nr:hypothetical protein HOY82DRAFT_618985 [Tuber indicum]